ncbi:MAG: AAA family ATPase [Ruminococcus sp.]|nr:AAA family ATPase [Ruminococcus sp.]
MIFYSYGFRWKGHVPEDTGSCTAVRPGGRVDSLHSEYSDMKLQELNESFYSDYLRHGKYVMSVVQRYDTELYVYAAVNIGVTESCVWEEKLSGSFPDCDMFSRKEVTIEDFRNEVGANRYGGSSKILDRLNIKYQVSWLDPLPFKLSESVPDHEAVSLEKCRERAKEILGSKSLYDEIDRIYSDQNKKKYYGHPVHYLISAGDWEAARDIFELLIEALYSNGRLLSCRQTEIRNMQRSVYRDDRYKTILRSAEGGIVIIEMSSEEDSGNLASTFHEVARVTGSILEKQKKDTLFIFVEITGRSFRNSEAINRLTSKADIIQITEGSGTIAEAQKYLMELTGKVDFYVDDPSEAVEYLPEQESYSVTDIFNAYNAWYGSGLKNHVYKAYKEQKTYKADVTRCGSKPYEELMSLIGLSEAKGVINQIISASKVLKARESMGLSTGSSSLHMLFSGNPGTAKTTVARLIAEVLKDEDVLKSGRFVECGRQDLVARFVGWTAKTVEEKFRAAQGGVLFIDEAYSLVDGSNSFGAEAINTIIQMMENYRNEVIVIFAGYNDRMQVFLEQNEGLRSRIAFHLNFPDYTPDELTGILRLMADKREYVFDDDALEECRDIFGMAVHEENFGNGRYVRNLLEQAILRQSDRIIRESQGRVLTRKEMCRIIKEDIRAVSTGRSSNTKMIGFAC